MRNRNLFFIGMVAAVFLMAQACSPGQKKNSSQSSQAMQEKSASTMDASTPAVTKAVCVLAPTEGNDVSGVLTNVYDAGEGDI